MLRVAAIVALAACATAFPFAENVGAPSECDGKDRDYCTVDKECMIDSTEKCIQSSCLIYNDETACKHDENSHGPCTWEWQLGVCYNTHDGIPCDRYYLDCPTDRCDDHPDMGVCTNKGEPPACVLYADDCPTDRCHLNEQQICVALHATTPCSDYYDAATCPSATCTFDSTASLCWPTDLTVPCNVYYDTAACPTDRCRIVKISEDYSSCEDKDGSIGCRLFDQADCPTTCTWSDAAQFCYDPKLGLDCSDYMNEADCPADTCRYADHSCHDKDAPFDCSMVYYGDEACNAENGCKPDCDNTECVPCPENVGKTCDDTPCGGVGPDPGANCYSHSIESECTADTDCKWDAAVNTCNSASMGVQCYEFLTSDQCLVEPKACYWDAGSCIECIQGSTECGTTITTTQIPDTGKACDTYDADQSSCPFPRCTLRWSENPDTPGESCDTSTCDDMYTEANCKSDKDCSWNTDVATCFITADGIPCDRLYEESSCNGDKTCEWLADSMQCSGKDTGKDCDTYNEGNCPTSRCALRYDAETPTCGDKTCFDHYEAETCIADGCTFDNATYICYKDTGKDCDTYTSYEDCPPNRCVFAEISGKEVCKIPTCGEVYSELSCEALDCSWDADQFICYKESTGDCKTFDQPNCPLNRCDWTNPDPESSDYSCLDKACGDYYDESVCQSKSCTWEPNKGMCYSDNGDACDTITDYRNCPANRCSFDYDLDKCRDISCFDLYDETDCTSSTLGCDYSSEYYVCYKKGSHIPCSVFSFTTDCPTDTCQFDSPSQICYDKGGSIPCHDLYEASTCTKNGCDWNADFFMCKDK